MNEQFQAAMREATRLTRAGRLREATELIQRTLHGQSIIAPATPAGSPPNDDIIEGSFRVTEPSVLPKAVHLFSDPSAPQPATAPPAKGPPVAPPQSMPTPSRPRPVEVTPRPERPGQRGTFLSATYTDHVGTRPYKLYIPSGYHGQALPLVVMLHGCTQTPDDFAAGTRMNLLAEEHNCFVVYPAQVRAANRSSCWNWFERADQQREQGEPALIAGITRQVCADYAIDAQRVFVAGLSAGGAMAVIMAITYPELYAAVGCHSGLPYGAAHDVSSALAAMGRAVKPLLRAGTAPTIAVPGARVLPLIVFHGDQDTTVHPRNTDELIDQWLMLHAGKLPLAASAQSPTPIIQRAQGGAGHAYTRTIYPDGDGQTLIERWLIHGANHAWSGGSPDGSFTSPREPDAARQMLRFFLAQPQPAQ